MSNIALEEIRALAAKALEDSRLMRLSPLPQAEFLANADLDKHHELLSLAARIEAKERAALDEQRRVDDEIAAIVEANVVNRCQAAARTVYLDSSFIAAILSARLPDDPHEPFPGAAAAILDRSV